MSRFGMANPKYQAAPFLHGATDVSNEGRDLVRQPPLEVRELLLGRYIFPNTMGAPVDEGKQGDMVDKLIKPKFNAGQTGAP